jgi:hypothetical protein
MNNELCEKYLDVHYGDNLEMETKIVSDGTRKDVLYRRYYHNDDKTVITFLGYPDGFIRVVGYDMFIIKQLTDWFGVEDYNEALDILERWVKTKFKYDG